MEQKKSEFNKVLNAWDVLVIAFGAMIGWGWVVSTGGWIEKGGVLGAAIGFVIGGIMIFFVGMTYAELTAAMPQCGGEHVFSYKAMGSTGSFICTWMIILGYVSVACFEACAFPTIITYLWPGFLKGYLYTVAGFDIYASWLIVAIVVAFLIMMINIIGAKTAAILQTVLTCIIGGAGILLIIASVINGTVDNLDGQMFAGSSAGLNVKAIIGVAALSPFYFIGFDVIPQAAEEINVPAKKIGSILILSVVLAVVFYALVIVAVGLVMGPQAIVDSEQATGLVTADAMAAAFNTKIMAKVIIVGGMCGIVTSWNSFMLGGSRAMYSMAESYMIPKFFAKLHPKHKTPINALILIGSLTMLAPFAGRKMLVWISDAGNFGCCVAYCMVALSFIILRKKELICQDHTRFLHTSSLEQWQLSCQASWLPCTVYREAAEHLSLMSGASCLHGVRSAWYSSSSVKRNTRSHLVHLLSSSLMRMLQHLCRRQMRLNWIRLSMLQ